MSETTRKAEVVICMGSSCFSRGNKHNIKTIKEFIERHGLNSKVVLKGHLCKGLCKDGPNVTMEGQTYHTVDSTSVGALLEQHLRAGVKEKPDA